MAERLESESNRTQLTDSLVWQLTVATMIIEEVPATSLRDKNEMSGRSEEDARTESSEGSNSQLQWPTDAAESEDEFVDAMEPPSSTSGVLLTFEGAAPPLSGVYEDAVEATDEQILAALTRSEGFKRMQSTIQEDEAENLKEDVDALDAKIDGDVIAVVERIVAVIEEAAEFYPEDSVSPEEEESGAQDKNPTEVLDEAVAQDDIVTIDSNSTESADGAVVYVAAVEECEGAATEEKTDKEEIEQVVDVTVATADIPAEVNTDVPEETVAGDPESSVGEVTTQEIDEAEAQKTTETDGKATEALASIASEESQQEADVDESESDVVETSNGHGTSDESADTTPEPMEETEIETPRQLEVEFLKETTAEQEAAPAVGDEPEAAEEATLNEADDDGTKESGAEELIETETITGSEQPCAAAVDHDKIVAEICDEAFSAKQEEAAQPSENASQDVVEQETMAIEEVVAQVADELIEAVQLENQTLDKKAKAETLETDAPDKDSVDEHLGTAGNTNAVVVETGDVAPAATAAPTSTAKGVCNDDNDHVVVNLLPTFGPSSGMTTTTTIEPFVLSSASNEMIEAHFPPQRWTYEVYGFSIKDRVVYYHIHRSDHRTGIRQPPVLKRYTDFRELQIQLLDTRLRASVDIPRIPRPHLGTVFRGYKSKKTIEMRESAFRALLRYISQYPELHGSAVFERFITTSRATTGAGWM
ncbi:hypothetical protein F442_00694 [Phytophthora nicotianae P10297]|uniref:PX domain-containing protein n=1 Tax=Phytophthora nicotianae P10297 TaxID=1317064 RepID=W3A601_PHYNI|nr:hypothetical protein F442_00694 [Phytophthora nicotianae P10297]